MKCEQCDAEATVHELRVVNGKRVERHLCENCARGSGIKIQAGLSVPEMIEKMLEQTMTTQGAKPAGPKTEPAKAAACPTCGTTFVEFRQTGLLGCLECYRAFEHQLGPLLERAHQGGTHHVGKLPKRALSGAPAAAPGRRAAESVLGGPEQRAVRVAALRQQLEEAIRSEQYERAAKIRDELRTMMNLQNPLPHSSPPGTEPDAV